MRSIIHTDVTNMKKYVLNLVFALFLISFFTSSLHASTFDVTVNKINHNDLRISSKQNSSSQIIFAHDRPYPFDSDGFLIPTGYNSITFQVTSTDSIINWAPAVSFDGGITYRNQHRFRCSGAICPVVTIPIISNLYRFSLGSASGNITAIGTLNKEKGARVVVLGNGVSLPFTSESFSTKRMSSIIVTVEQGNPQNLTGISLQKNVNGIYVEKAHLVCDGGAECPLEAMPVDGGNYRIVMEGSGSDALLSIMLRK